MRGEFARKIGQSDGMRSITLTDIRVSRVYFVMPTCVNA